MMNAFFRFRFTFLFSFIGFAILILVAAACQKTSYTVSYSEGLKPIPGGPRLPSEPYPYPNFVDNNVATLGRVLFYDKNLSQDNSVSCSSCHQQAYGFADNKAFSTGFAGQHTVRNAHSLVSTNDSKFWDGKVAGASPGGDGGYGGGQATNIVSVPFQSHLELNVLDGNALCSKLASLPYYPYLFNQAFHSTTVTLSQIQFAIATFISTITGSNSRYDQAFPAPNGFPATVTLNQQEIDGMNVFNGKGRCASCHIAANSFGGSDGQFEDIGLDVNYTDLGRGAITNNPFDNGKFHVPALKNVALTAPYMHDGRFKTLVEVVNFFSDSVQNSPNLSATLKSGGMAVRMGLSPYEKSSLIAFLQTLTDNNLVTDIRYSDPFKH